MIELGFPFLKVRLFSIGRLPPDAPEVTVTLSADLRDALTRHLAVRVDSAGPRVRDPNQPARPTSNKAWALHKTWYAAILELARCSRARADPALRRARAGHAAQGAGGGALLLHRCCRSHSDPHGRSGHGGSRSAVRLCPDHGQRGQQAETLRDILARLGLIADVMVCPNRGRDVAPFLTACAAHIEGVDLVLHLHTKKSPQDSELAGWGAFLFDNLIGTPDVVCSILHLFDSEETGLVYSGSPAPHRHNSQLGHMTFLPRGIC